MAGTAGYCQENRQIGGEVKGGAAVTSRGRRKRQHIDKKSSGRVSQKNNTPGLTVEWLSHAKRASNPYRLAVSIIIIKGSPPVREATNARRTTIHPNKKKERTRGEDQKGWG